MRAPCNALVVPLLLAASALACGADPMSSGTPPTGASSTTATALLAELPAGLVNVELVDSVQSHGCSYTVGTAEDPAEFGPPTYVVFLQSEPLRANADCATGFVLLGVSTIRPQTELAVQRGRDAIVVGFTQKDTFSGAGFVHTEIVHIDATTGDVLHHTTLAALPPFGTGTVVPDDLALKGNGTLTVSGTKNGVIPGETGSGDAFIAVYDGFLFDDDPTPVPTSVTAF